MPSPVFRLAKEEDALQMANLRIRMQKEANNLTDTDIHPDSFRNIHQYFSLSLKQGSHTAVVADIDGEVVAVGGLSFYQKPPSLKGGNGLVGYVTNVYTLPEWRGQGLATGIIKEIVKEAGRAGADKLQLGATKAGEGVYRRLGFEDMRHAALQLTLKK